MKEMYDVLLFNELFKVIYGLEVDNIFCFDCFN